MFGIPREGEIDYSVDLDLDLTAVQPSVAGPKRPQDRIELPKLKNEFIAVFERPVAEGGYGKSREDAAIARPNSASILSPELSFTSLPF